MVKFPQYLEQRHFKWFRSNDSGIHSRSECQKLVSQDIDLADFKCCKCWQKKLSNKWNARILAQKLGVPVPELYWHGTKEQIDQMPFDKFPECYVIKPTSAWSCIGVFVMVRGINQFDGRRHTPESLRQELKKIAQKYPKTAFLVEEMVQNEAGEFKIPIDFKCHVFGGQLESILAIRRRDSHSGWAAFYDRNWNHKGGSRASDPTLHIAPYKAEVIPAPKCLNQLVEYAEKLGAFYGSFVRIDFYATPRGAVFGEFTPSPNAGHHYNNYADSWLERWQRLDPELFNGTVGDGKVSIGLNRAMINNANGTKKILSDRGKQTTKRRSLIGRQTTKKPTVSERKSISDRRPTAWRKSRSVPKQPRTKNHASSSNSNPLPNLEL